MRKPFLRDSAEPLGDLALIEILATGVSLLRPEPSVISRAVRAVRVQYIMDLLHPPQYFDELTGKIVRPEALITKEQALELLGEIE